MSEGVDPRPVDPMVLTQSALQDEALGLEHWNESVPSGVGLGGEFVEAE